MIKFNRKIAAWILLIILIYIIIRYNKDNKSQPDLIEESFSNYHDNKSIYDNYYAMLYDKIFYSEHKNNYELINIQEYAIDKWDNKQNISILDLGSGTGRHIEILSKKYKTTGVDNSEAMLSIARKNIKAIKNKKFNPILVEGDITESDLFDGNKFSHIICMFFTFYYIPDKRVFFKNCNYWLKKDGILVLHLVNRKKFDPILDKASPFPMFSLQRYTDSRPSKSVLVFDQFRYDTIFKFSNDKASFEEKITFNNNKNNRVNVHTFYMPSVKQILDIAKQYSFRVIGNTDLTNGGFEYQYLFFLQKI